MGQATSRRLWAIALVALLIAVAWLALTPHPPRQADTGWDKLNHVIAFAALAFTAGRCRLPFRFPLWVTGAGLLLYGAGIEWAQTHIPQRSGEWGDLLADAVGIGLGLLLARLLAATQRALRR